jgi:PAS domain S-box-containing protein
VVGSDGAPATIEPAVKRDTGSELELADDVLRGAINAAPDGIIVVDERGIIEFANPMAARLFGYGDDELAGQSVDALVPDQLRAGHAAHRESYTRLPRTRAMGSGLDLRGRKRTGEEFPVEISLSPVVRDGHTRVIAVIRDVTETEGSGRRAHARA